jgi:hypothetical protein
MNRSEWTSCVDPVEMLEFSKTRLTEQQLRLFSRECSRRVLHLIQDARFERLLDLAERRDNGPVDPKNEKALGDEVAQVYDLEASAQEVPSARVLAMCAVGESVFKRSAFDAAVSVSTTAAEAIGIFAGEQVETGRFDEVHDQAFQAEQAAQATILRDLWGQHVNELFSEG